MGLSDVLPLVVIAVVLVVIAMSVAASWDNPVVEVADEMTTTMSVAQAESLIGEALAVVPRVQVCTVLPGTRTVSYRHHPRYAVALGILTLPVGLLVLLLVRETLLLTVSVTRDAGSTRVLVVGRAHKKPAVALGEGLWGLMAVQVERA